MAGQEIFQTPLVVGVSPGFSRRVVLTPNSTKEILFDSLTLS